MEVIQTKLKKWGNSMAVVIPAEIVNKEKMGENQEIKILILRDSHKALKETFGIGKGRLKKTGQEIKDELRRELYND